MSRTVDSRLVEIALDKIDGNTFEDFAQEFVAGTFGPDFQPVGGMHDGGADGAFSPRVLERPDRPGVYLQCSVEKDYESKIRRTLADLKDGGRRVKTLHYASSLPIRKVDLEADRLSEVFDVNVRLYDREYLVKHVNHNDATRAAFETHLKPRLSYLREFGRTRIPIAGTDTAPASVYVFLRQEIERRSGRTNLMNSLTDGLILKALEGTDPDKNVFMTVSQVRDRIVALVPVAKKLVSTLIPSRLEHLSRVKRETRYVRRHGDRYCLAFEVRQRIEDENAEDEFVRVKVREVWRERLSSQRCRWRHEELERALDATFAAVQKTFHRRGLEFASFLEGREGDHALFIEDAVREAMDERGLGGARRAEYAEAILETLRRAFYYSEPVERTFFRKLNLTYTLLFCLNTDERVAGFFTGMAGEFHLYVGADVIVRALSEHYVQESARMMRNTLEIIRRAGGRLVLAEPVLKEVLGHIRESDLAYDRSFAGLDDALTLTDGRQADKILIRAYYYARKDPPPNVKSPATWPAFVNQVVPYRELHSPAARDLLKDYLSNEFGMVFAPYNELVKDVKRETRERIAASLAEEKASPQLADNDALMALATYARRRRHEQQARDRLYGYRTWWLTFETIILRHTGDLIQKEGAPYLIRPEFLLNFLTLAPSKGEVKETIGRLFPGLLGLSLARRVDGEVLEEVLTKYREAEDLPPSRRQAENARNADLLKAQYFGQDKRHVAPAQPAAKPGSGHRHAGSDRAFAGRPAGRRK